MKSNFEDEYLDVLQNIEFAIVAVYRDNPELTNYDVDKAINALMRAYRAEQQQRTVNTPALSPLSEAVYDGVHTMCEWRLGRESFQSEDGDTKMTMSNPITIEEIQACLKRIRKSIKTWDKAGGRQGYLHYIDQFIA